MLIHLRKFQSVEEIEAKLLKVRQAYEDLADISTCTPLMIYSPHIIEGFMERWITEATEFPHPSKVHFMSEAFQVVFFSLQLVLLKLYFCFSDFKSRIPCLQ